MGHYKHIPLLSLLLVLSFFDANCQYKNDIWVVGGTPLLFKFENGVLKDTIYTNSAIYFKEAHSNISDTTGLLFSCNGFNIYDKYGNAMENGNQLVPNKIAIYAGISNLHQQSIILPKKDNKFYVFIWSLSDSLFDSIINGASTWHWDILTYSIVDMNENGGKGKVISKMNYILEDETLSASQMSAVRHANGRDWWLVKPHERKHRFYTFLVTPDGIQKQPIQEFDSPTFINGVDGQSNFSMDGSLYVMTAEANPQLTQINYFDRCTGKMGKYKTIPWIYDSISQQLMVVSTACFSPDNQFVYLINNVSIVQYDLNTNERIEINNGLYNPCNNVTSYNAPDGKIYIGNFNELCSALSYIEFPNKKGKNAHYCPLCFHTKNNNTKSPPNMPNYELGALLGSACDTIKPTHPLKSGIKIYPNPVTDKLIIELPTGSKEAEVIVLTMIGEVLLKKLFLSILNDKIELNLNYFTKGIYNIKVVANEEIFIERFLKN